GRSSQARSEAFHRARVRLDFGPCGESARRQTTATRKGRTFISQPQTNMTYIELFEPELAKKLQAGEDTADRPGSDSGLGFRCCSGIQHSVLVIPLLVCRQTHSSQRSPFPANFPCPPFLWPAHWQ